MREKIQERRKKTQNFPLVSTTYNGSFIIYSMENVKVLMSINTRWTTSVYFSLLFQQSP